MILGLNYSPELTGIGKYTGEMAAWLAARGHAVRVVTAPPYYPAWRVDAAYRSYWYRVEGGGPAGDGVVVPLVIRCPLFVPRVPTGMARIWHLASFALSAVPAMLSQVFSRPDVVLTIEPTFFCAPLALGCAALADAPAWLHVQDFEVDAAFDLGLLPAKGPVHAFAMRMERLFTRSFRKVSSISPRMVERTLLKDVPPKCAVLFPNWVDVNLIQRSAQGVRNRLRDELGLGDKVVLLYSGNMGSKQGLDLLAPLAAAFVDQPEVHFLYCGDGAYRPRLEMEAGGMANVTLLPLQPLERLNELLNAADIHLLPQRADAADLVMPSKLTGMLASGRPMVVTAAEGTQVARVVTGSESHLARGIVVPPADLNALVAAVKRLVADRALRLQMGDAARSYAVEFLGRDRVLLQFEQDLAQVVREYRGIDETQAAKPEMRRAAIR